ncbi:MAG: glycerol-3-phosphate 1-O-acyltransferase PlsY [Patescibacteria group bacterium]
MLLIMIISAYLLGSIITGSILAKIKGIDIRQSGSGNPGATNAFRAMGWKIGALTLLGDVTKGVMPVWIGYLIGFRYWELAAIGAAVFIGHLFPAFSHFKGGKGVATAAGIFLVLNPGGLGIAALAFVLVYGISRYVSLASILGAAAVFFVQIIRLAPWHYPNLSLTIFSFAVFIAILYSHRKNIEKLWNGTEKKVYFKWGRAKN